MKTMFNILSLLYTIAVLLTVLGIVKPNPVAEIVSGIVLLMFGINVILGKL